MKSLLVSANRNLALVMCGAIALVSFGLFAVQQSDALETDPSELVLTPRYLPDWLPAGVRLNRTPTDPVPAATETVVQEMALPGTPVLVEVLGSPSDESFRFVQAWPRVGDELPDDPAVAGASARRVGALRVLVRSEGALTTMSWKEPDGTRITATAKVAESDVDRFVGSVHRASALEWKRCCSDLVTERVTTL